MSKIINYIPLKNILADYELMMSDLAQVGEDTVLQWASDALDKLNIGKTLDYQVALLDVFNYTAMLPKGLVSIVQIAYNQQNASNCNNLIPVVAEAVVGMCNDCEIKIKYEAECPNGDCPPTTCPINTPLLTVNGTNASQIAPWIGYSRVVYTSADYNNPLTRLWQPLRLCNNSYHNLHYHIKDCINVDVLNRSINSTKNPNHNVQNTNLPAQNYWANTPCYSIVNGKIVTDSLRESQLLIAYLTKKVDEEGYPMIPEDIHVIDAVMAYIQEKLAQRDYAADKGQASRQYFIDMSGLRKLAFSAAINKFNMMSTEEMENLNQMLSTVLPNKNAYANFFNRK